MTPSASSEDNFSIATRFNEEINLPLDSSYDFTLPIQQQQLQLQQQLQQQKQHYGKLLLPKPQQQNSDQLYLKRSNTIPFRNQNSIRNSKAVALMNKCRKTIKDTTHSLYNNAVCATPLVSTTLPLSETVSLSNKIINENALTNSKVNSKNNNQKFVFDSKLFLPPSIDNIDNTFELTKTTYVNNKTADLNKNNNINSTTPTTATTVNTELAFNNSFGQHLVHFLPFIDSLSYSEERLLNYCTEEKKMPYLYSDFPFVNNEIFLHEYNSVSTPINLLPIHQVYKFFFINNISFEL